MDNNWQKNMKKKELYWSAKPSNVGLVIKESNEIEVKKMSCPKREVKQEPACYKFLCTKPHFNMNPQLQVDATSQVLITDSLSEILPRLDHSFQCC